MKSYGCAPGSGKILSTGDSHYRTKCNKRTEPVAVITRTVITSSQPPPPPKKSPVFKINQKSYLPSEITKYKRETVVRCHCMEIWSHESEYKSQTAETRALIEWSPSLALVKVGLSDKRGIFTGLYKGKEIPLQASTHPEGSRRMRHPDFKTIGI